MRWLSFGFRAGRFQVRNPIPLMIRRVWGLLHAAAEMPPADVMRKFGEGVRAQVSSSSSDSGSKLRGPAILSSQNSLRVVSKRAINIIKLN
ncbi:hypothetical protein AVEN_26345-1 [Araneus ventricosus]|uniref:Uncharacterized protein n=1 Tax=Araneus ventricosus TaxID=182803 RepID=A0A4Y2AM27_ARAVE|nr:hypothetical protein AVEN_26345-1 [Araneus ventricosus]